MWFFSLLILLGIPLSLFLHELSHCIVVWIYKGTVTSFKPYPHKVNGKLYIGRIIFEGGEWTQKRAALRHAAPFLKALTMIHIWLLLSFTVSPVFTALIPAEATDILDFTKDFIMNNDSDGGRFRKAMGWMS